jgi:hypothetical protein
MIPIVKTDRSPIVGRQTPGITAADRDLHRHLAPGREGQRKASSGTGKGGGRLRRSRPAAARFPSMIPWSDNPCRRGGGLAFDAIRGHMVISGWTVAPKVTGGGIQARGVSPCETLSCRRCLSGLSGGRLMALERERVPFFVKKPDCAPGASYSLGGASCDTFCRRPHPGERGYTVTNAAPRAVRENRAIWINPTLSRTWPIESGKKAKPLMFNGCRCEGLHYTMVARRPPIP